MIGDVSSDQSEVLRQTVSLSVRLETPRAQRETQDHSAFSVKALDGSLSQQRCYLLQSSQDVVHEMTQNKRGGVTKEGDLL